MFHARLYIGEFGYSTLTELEIQLMHIHGATVLII